MDAYDIFRKLSKGLTFKNKQLHKKIQPETKLPPISIKRELEHSDDEEDKSFEDEPDEINNSALDSAYDLKLTSGLVVDKDGVKKVKKKKKKPKAMTPKKLSAIEIEEAKRCRSEFGIKTRGANPTKPLKDFFSLVDDYNVPNTFVESLIQCGYMEPTPIQRQAIPCMLENRQILACAPTGSGKTAAFLLPVLNALRTPQKGIRCLILCPTRELAKQTYREALRLSAGTNLSINFVPKISPEKLDSKVKIIRKTDLLISTPNRLCYLLAHESVNLNLDSVQWLIVDEADKLFEGSDKNESDFRPQLEKVMKSCGTQTKLSLFSATQTPILVDWCRRNIDQFLCITVGQRNAATELVEQELKFVGSESGKLVAFRQLIQKGLKPPVLVFVQSKDRAKQLFKELIYDGINVDVIHADRTQLQRDNVVKSFRTGKIWILICTELMGRGIDFRGVNLVINYDFPPSSISYVHRIGRAGRAGQKGKAVTFFTQDDIQNLKSIVVVMRQSGCEIPEYMLTLNQTRKNRQKLLKFAPNREDISTDLNSKRGKKRKMIPNKSTPEKKRKFDKENKIISNPKISKRKATKNVKTPK